MTFVGFYSSEQKQHKKKKYLLKGSLKCTPFTTWLWSSLTNGRWVRLTCKVLRLFFQALERCITFFYYRHGNMAIPLSPVSADFIGKTYIHKITFKFIL